MQNNAIRFLAFFLGVLLLFHGLNRMLEGTEYIQRLILDLYVPRVEDEVPFGMWFSPFMPNRIFMGKVLVGEEFRTSLEYVKIIAYGVYLPEVIAPIFLLFGQYIRMAGLLVAVHMLIVVFLAYRDVMFQVNEFGAWSLEVPALYFLAMMVIVFSKKMNFR